SHRALSEHKTLSISWSHYLQRLGLEDIAADLAAHNLLPA
ncbi:hypothetical protein, partial [Escherichia coli]